MSDQSLEKAILAGGCFWGMQDLLRKIEGVVSTRVGYTGGTVENATYADLRTGKSGHAEAIEISYDPLIVSYKKILEWFFQIHDPTTKDRQGNDRGSQYRSAIFFSSQSQAEIAEIVIKAMDASGNWPGPIVTEIIPASDFWEAEQDHQDYLEKFPNGYTCHYVRPEWKLD